VDFNKIWNREHRSAATVAGKFSFDHYRLNTNPHLHTTKIEVCNLKKKKSNCAEIYFPAIKSVSVI
jgi:hypothetical protein